MKVVDSSNSDKISVVLVEDDPGLLELTQEVLASDGFEVFCFPNAETALQNDGLKEADIIVCDVSLPGMNGFDFYRKVREQTCFAYVPVVFLSAFHDEEIEQAALAIGVDDFLLKPVKHENLVKRLRGKIERSRQIRRDAADEIRHYRRRVITTLSHEFRTPLVSVITASEILNKDILNGKALELKKLQRLLGAVQRGGVRLERLVNDFMTMQKIEAGYAASLYEKQSSLQSASTTIREVECAASKDSLGKKHAFKTELVGEDCTFFACEPHVLEVLSRLISNAFKFSPKGSTVEMVVEADKDNIFFSILDSGDGIDAHTVETALTPFMQIGREQHEQQGSGLGLAIANSLIAINKGRLELRNREGGGALARVILPRSSGRDSV